MAVFIREIGAPEQAERHRAPAEDGGTPVDRVHGSPHASPNAIFFEHAARVSGATKCHMRFSPGYPRLPQDVERAAARLRGSRGPEEQSDPSQSNVRYPAPSTACPLLALTAGDRSTETVDIFVDKLRSDAQRGRNCYVATELPKI